MPALGRFQLFRFLTESLPGHYTQYGGIPSSTGWPELTFLIFSIFLAVPVIIFWREILICRMISSDESVRKFPD